MTPFDYTRPSTIAGALDALAAAPGAALLAGGTCLIDLMKQGVERPRTVVDVSSVAELRGITIMPSGHLRIGAATPLAVVARSEVVERSWPLLHETIIDGLTPQLRNAASFGGNVMQRPRCFYFREPGFACNKRAPGSGCAAQAGVHYGHAILGGDEARSCIAVHPSDLCVSLHALDAAVNIAGPNGTRVVPMADFHRLPGADPGPETNLRQGELITAIEIAPEHGRGGAYVKGTEGFTLASCAALLSVEDGIIVTARVVLGGVAHKPWRAAAAEEVLVGVPPGAAAFARAIEATVGGATVDAQTAFRLPLLRVVMKKALETAIARSGARS